MSQLTVGELIEKLKVYDPKTPVWFDNEYLEEWQPIEWVNSEIDSVVISGCDQ